MLTSLVMFSRNHQDAVAKVVDGIKAIAMGLIAQLLMFGLEMAMELSDFPFPSSILAMFVLFLFLLLLGCCCGGFEDFYDRHLRQPVSFIDTRGPNVLPWVTDMLIQGKPPEQTHVHRLFGTDSHAGAPSCGFG